MRQSIEDYFNELYQNYDGTEDPIYFENEEKYIDHCVSEWYKQWEKERREEEEWEKNGGGDDWDDVLDDMERIIDIVSKNIVEYRESGVYASYLRISSITSNTIKESEKIIADIEHIKNMAYEVKVYGQEWNKRRLEQLLEKVHILEMELKLKKGRRKKK